MNRPCADDRKERIFFLDLPPEMFNISKAIYSSAFDLCPFQTGCKFSLALYFGAFAGAVFCGYPGIFTGGSIVSLSLVPTDETRGLFSQTLIRK